MATDVRTLTDEQRQRVRQIVHNVGTHGLLSKQAAMRAAMDVSVFVDFGLGTWLRDRAKAMTRPMRTVDVLGSIREWERADASR